MLADYNQGVTVQVETLQSHLRLKATNMLRVFEISKEVNSPVDGKKG